MIRIINNTDQNVARLLYLYKPELDTVKHLNIESIVFDSCRVLVWGVDELLLEVDERNSDHRAEDEAREYYNGVF